MIKKFYSTAKKKPGWKWDAAKKRFWSWGYNIRLLSGKRVQETGFHSEADAIIAVGVIRKADKDKKYGFIPDSAKPRLAALVEKRLKDIKRHSEHVRATRVLNTLMTLLGPNKKIEDITTPDLKKFVEKREADGQAPSSVDRELNIIGPMLNSAAGYFPLLAQWKPPKLPHPKLSKKRRERTYTDEERTKLIAWLTAPRAEGEQLQSAQARYRIGRKLQFALSVGLRHGELNRIRKPDINWSKKSLKIVGTKTEFVANPTRYVTPLTAFELSILREFCESSETDYVFTRAGNESSKFYRIFKTACEKCDIPYGRNTEDGLTFHDARHDITTRLLEEGVSPATVQAQMGWSDQKMVYYYSHATPKSRQFSAEVRESLSSNKPEEMQVSLSPEMIAALSQMVTDGRLSPLALAAILRGEEKIEPEILEEIMQMV